MKKCFAASSGGHMEELSRLRELVDKEDIVFTEKCDYISVDWAPQIYHVFQINRKELFFLFKFIYLFFVCWRIIVKEKPEVIISTGALATFPLCLVGKLMGKKIIFIESFARIEKRSLTGRLVYPFSDLFIVQWKEMLALYPNAVYGGGIF